MAINKQVYAPLLNELCEVAAKFDKSSWPPNGVFIPYTFEKYSLAEKKIFYVGRDTYGWIKFCEMMDYCNAGRIEDYLDKNTQVVTVQGENNDKDKHSLKENWNKGAGFWTFCQKLHLYIRTGRIVSDLRQLTPDYYSILEEMGYSNINAIEIPVTIDCLGEWGNIKNREGYWTIFDASKSVSDIKALIQAYSPDLLIVLNKDASFSVPTKVFQVIDGLGDILAIEGKRTKIIRCPHPNRFKFEGIRTIDAITRIGNAAIELLK